MHKSLNLTAFLVEPKTPNGMFGYQIGSFDADKTWLPLVIVSSKFLTVEEASIHSDRQLKMTERALLKKTLRGISKTKIPCRRRDDGGPGAA
jgi:hypothetical protein